MNTRLILLSTGIVIAHMAIAILFISCKNDIYREHRSRITAMKQEHKQAEQEKSREHKNLLSEKYGVDELDRLALDPRLDIRLVLEKMFENVVPGHWRVEVTVDRFTEFKVYVKAGILKQPDELSEYLKQVFSRIKTDYVYEIVFSKGDKAYFIDREDLEKIGDWENASIARIKRYCFPD
ncbi:MAG: hypothetical protein R6V10_02490 [bacterium]